MTRTLSMSSRSRLLLGVSAAALVSIGAQASADDMFRKGVPDPAAAAAQAAASRATQDAAASSATQRTIEAFQRAALARSRMDAAQAAARAAALAAQSLTPNGLGIAGLQAAGGATDPALWIGAAAPVQSQGGDGRVKVVVDQNQAKAILNWDSFNVGRETDLVFNQHGDSTWAVLNRVTDAAADPSRILGTIKADGTVLVLNRNGVIFGGASQVNARNIVAAAAGLSNEQFLNRGIYSALVGGGYAPAFTGAGGPVRVEAGAVLTTKAPVSVLDGGGYVMLLGASATNAGAIVTPKGQALLAAGDDFLIRKGQGTDANAYSTTRGSEVRALINAAGVSGLVVNSGRIEAAQGDITLTGRDVRQQGVLLATTSVNARGSIHLSTSAGDAAGQVTLAKDSLTAILPELDSADTALNAQRDSLIADSKTQDSARSQASFGQFDNLAKLQDRRDQSRVEIVSGGGVVFDSGSTTLAQGGQIAVAASAGRAQVRDGAMLDVSGVRGVALDVGSNAIKVNIQGNELRDSAANRDGGALKNQDVWVDARSLVLLPSGAGGYQGDRYYTAGGLLEVGGYLGAASHKIGEWAAVGGTITLSAATVAADRGAVFNVAGGSVDYSGGGVLSTRLQGADGRLYDINDAPAAMTFVSVGRSQTVKHDRWGGRYDETYAGGVFNRGVYVRDEAAYSVGRDGGALVLSTPTALFDGEIVADVLAGARQVKARPHATVADGYKLGQNQAALAGGLVYGRYGALGLQGAFATDVRFVGAADLAAATPDARVGTAWFDAARLSGFGLGRIDVSTGSDARVGADLTLADGGRFSLVATNTRIDAGVTARSGDIWVSNVYNDAIGNLVAAKGSIVLGAGGALDVRGKWSNALVTPGDAAGLAYVDGGSVTLRATQDVTLAKGSRIDASSGAAVAPDGSLRGGRGGDVILKADYSANVGDGTGRVTLGGDIRAYGVLGGGTLTVEGGPAMTVGGSVLKLDGVLSPSERPGVDLVTAEPYRVAAGEPLPFDYDYIRTVGAPGTIIGGQPSFSADKPVTLAQDWSPPLAVRFPYTLIVDGVPVQVTALARPTLRAGAVISGVSGAFYFPLDYVVPANVFPNGIPITPTPTSLKAGDLAPTDVVFAAGSRLAAGQAVARPVKVQPLQSLDARLFSTGFSNYVIDGHQGLAVAPGARIEVTTPVYRATGDALNTPGGVDPRTALQLWTPPVYNEDPTAGRLTQRAGANLVLASNAARLGVGGGVSIGTGSTISVDPGATISVQAVGPIVVDGRLTAPGGVIDVLQLNTKSNGGAPADPDVRQRSIVIGDHAVLDAAARAATAVDRQGLRYGVVPNGGAITIGAPTLLNNPGGVAQGAEAFVVVRPGAVLDASGTSATVDLPRKGAAATATTVASNGGSIALNTLMGLYVDGTLRAAAGGPGGLGGTLILTQETPRYANLTVPDDLHRVHELVIGQTYKDSGFSSGPLLVGAGRISVEQIKAGGFDSFTALADLMHFDGSVDLSLGRSISLYHGALTSDGSAMRVRLAAPYVELNAAPYRSLEGAPLYPKAVGPQTTISKLATKASFVVEAGLIDLGQLTLHGVTAKIPTTSVDRVYDEAGFDTAVLTSSGDIRLGGGVTGSRLLDLNAAQLYPFISAIGRVPNYNDITVIKALEKVRIGRTTTDVPAMPYSLYGGVRIWSKEIEQGGILRAPLGLIQLGEASGASRYYDTSIVAEKVTLLPGGVTSVSANGLAIPYGGTIDGLTYLNAGNTIDRRLGSAPSVVLAGKSNDVRAGAIIDLSGGGDVLGGGFVTGRGGSVDVLSTALANAGPGYRYSNPGDAVYALVPGAQPGAAPVGAGAGDLPEVGRQVTIPDGVPGLKAGTYTLMPARYALVPGAYRVELAGRAGMATDTAIDVGNGVWSLQGYLGYAGTSQRDVLPTQLLISSGAAVRAQSQYNETGVAAFLAADAVRAGTAAPYLPQDAKTLELRFPTTLGQGPAFSFAGQALVAPGKGGEGAILNVQFGSVSVGNMEVIHSGAAATSGYVTLVDDVLNSVGASRIALGGYARWDGVNGVMTVVSGSRSMAVRGGASLAAPEILLISERGGVKIEDGARVSTLGFGDATPYSASEGYRYGVQGGVNFQTNLVAISNGLLNIAATAGDGTGLGINIGAAELYANGSLTLATSVKGALSLSRNARYGARYLTLALSNINIGEAPALDAAAAAGVLPAGLSFTQDSLNTLLQGNKAVGAPKLETLILSAGQAVNFFGPSTLNTIDPATGKSSLAQLVLNTPAIYGLGAAGDVATLTTGTLIWNGVAAGTAQKPTSASPPAVRPGGPGTGLGTLNIVADRIEFGYDKFGKPDTQLTLDRTILGFSTVNLTAGERITANNRNSLSVYRAKAANGSYVGGDLNLTTPLLTGAGASINRLTAGGALTLTAPAGATAAAVDVTGAEIGLKGAVVTVAGSIVLPTGKLTLEADQDLRLTSASRIDVSGRTVTLVDAVKYSWGGDVVLSSAHGGVRQDAGSVIDLSASNNAAGSLSATALDAGAGVVTLAGDIRGGASGQRALDGVSVPYLGATIDVRAQTVADFAGLNQRLTQGGVLGGRSFQIKRGDLTVGDELKGRDIALSLDGGALTVAGRIDASGPQVGSIRLSARDGLTLASTAVLDAHGTVLRTDSYGQPIDASNRATVELTASRGTLRLSPGATIDLSAPDGVARGQIGLNAPRTGETSGDILIAASGPLTIKGAGSIAVNGFWTYSPTDAKGTIVQDNGDAGGSPVSASGQVGLNQINGRSAQFMTAALANGDLLGRLGGLSAYKDAFHLRPGVEIDSATPNGVLTVASDLDLSGFRYASLNPRFQKTAVYGSGEPGALVIRAGGDLAVKGSVNDGFAPPPATPDDNGWRVTVTVNIGDPLTKALTSTDPVTFTTDYHLPADCWNCMVFAIDGGAYFNGDTVPAGTTSSYLELEAGMPSPFAYSSTGPRQPPGKVWAVSPMLASGSLSWSMRLAAGADLAAADSRRTGQARAGDLVLDDEHFTGADFSMKAFSVVRTGTGNLDLVAGGSVNMKTLYGVYTAGTAAAPILAADGSNPYQQPRGLARTGDVLGSTGAAYEPLVRGPSSIYQAWYPEGGGDLFVSAQADVTGYITAGDYGSSQLLTGVTPNWLWRQGGSPSGLPAAWWVNFGTYGLPTSGYGVAQLVGFSGFGALGGGNVVVNAGRDAGLVTDIGAGSGNKVGQGLNIAVGGSGRVTADGRLVQTGGGDVTVRVGGALNPLKTGNISSAFIGMEGGVTDLRGAVDVRAGSIGRIDQGYGIAFGVLPGDPRATDPNALNWGAVSGGLFLNLGDANAWLRSRGDLALAAADNAGMGDQYNTTPFTYVQNGGSTPYAGGGSTWFSLWTDNTSVDLFAAGGNLSPVRLDRGQSRDYPATLRAVAAQGNIFYGVDRDTIVPLVTSVTLAPSPRGQLEILARKSIFALRSVMDMSGADPSVVPTPFRAAFNAAGAPVTNLTADGGGLFSGSMMYAFGPNSALGALHAGDRQPMLFYAAEGDIVGLRTGELLDHTNGGSEVSRYVLDRWYVGAKSVRIIAGRDIIGSGEPVAYYTGDTPRYSTGRYSSASLGDLIVNANADDVSVVRAGRDILVSNFMVAGPGTLEVTAGRNLYQADKGSITSLGAIAAGDKRLGASVTVTAGAGAAGPDYAALAARYLDPANLADPTHPLADQAGKAAKTYERELVDWLKARYGFAGGVAEARAYFTALPPEQRNVFLRKVYFAELDAGGREYNDVSSKRFGSYLRGREMIATLFPEKDAKGAAIVRGGDITLFGGSGVRSNFGGDVQILAPAGQVLIGVQGVAPPASAGVVTQGSGDIAIYSRRSLLLGLSRVMTTFGGDILAWSAEGDINAGRGAKTTVIFTPPRRAYDDMGDVSLSPLAPSSGAGIATLNPIPEVPPGNVNLIAPLGTIDAGEAGIRVSGNVNLAALHVVNAANIQVQGEAKGLPVVAAVNTGALTAASAAAGAVAGEAARIAERARPEPMREAPTILNVRFLGFGPAE